MMQTIKEVFPIYLRLLEGEKLAEKSEAAEQEKKTDAGEKPGKEE